MAEGSAVVNIINEELGDELTDISKAKRLVARLEETRNALQIKISAGDDGAPDEIGHVLRSADKALTEAERLLESRDTLLASAQAHSSKIEGEIVEWATAIDKVEELEKYRRYLQTIQFVEELSTEIQTAVEDNTHKKAVASYMKLASTCQSVQDSSCKHLVGFIEETTQFWHNILKARFASEFMDLMKLLKWPFIPSVPGSIPMPSNDLLFRFECSFTLLLDIQLPCHLLKDANASDAFPALLLPLQLMVKPFQKRFFFHFSGNRKTNSIYKPEWYYTQALSWIRDHIGYLDRYVQPILTRSGRSDIAKSEFLRSIVQLVVAKLSADIKELLYDDSVLTHTIDETLNFERELRKFGYLGKKPSCLAVLTQDVCFNRWIHLEKKLAQSNVDKLLSSESAWRSQYQDHSDVDENKVPESAEQFLTMLLSITDRYKTLPLPGHRLQFLELQLELIDDFRLRLHQLLDSSEPLAPTFCAILNVVYYITHVLKDWSDLPFFLRMQYYRLQFMTLQKSMQLQRSMTEISPGEASGHATPETHLSTSGSSIHKEALDSIKEELNDAALFSIQGTVFEDSVKLFEHMQEERMATLATSVVMEVKAKSRPYRHEKWFSLPPVKDFVSPTVSPSACGMLTVLSSTLHCLKQSLAVPLLNIAWQAIAEQLNAFIYEEVILMNHFNEGGASQLHFDMTRNVFPIFAEFTRKPENYFKDVKEACILLTLSKGSSLLLKEALSADRDQPTTHPSTDPVHALQDVGIHRLSPKQALFVLNLRTDLTNMS